MKNLKSSLLVAPFFAAALSIGVALPASAQQQRGLVIVNISDVAVQVPVSVAANVCGVAVNVIARDTGPGETACEIDDPQAVAEAVNNRSVRRFADRQGLLEELDGLLS
jgi:hypothetical protein